MPKLYSAREIVKILKRKELVLYKSHKRETLRTVIIPAHKEVTRGTFSSILKQAGMEEGEFEQFIK